MAGRTPEEQLEQFKELFRNNRLEKGSKIFTASVEWVKNFPLTLKNDQKMEIRSLMCNAFQISEQELDDELYGKKNGTSVKTTVALVDKEAITLETELDSILPPKGFIRQYVKYTERSEAPLAYHVFCALCGIGSVLNRRVYLDMGYYKVFPTLGILILGPSGIKKTSAANITVDLLQTLGITEIYSEKLTPEALIDAMKGENATGLVYAPEMAVFINKQKYNEGLVQLITRFMDCPDVWESGTIGRGKVTLRNVAISSLMCSTLDWFIRATPEDTFGGGFVARNLLIVQEASARCEPIPRPGDPTLRERLMEHLAYLHTFNGPITLSTSAHNAYVDWYKTDHMTETKYPEHDLLATYYNRKPDHVKRIAICMHAVTCDNTEVCLDCWNRALQLINWTEQFLPKMLSQMFKSASGEEQEQVLRIIRIAGRIGHSDLIRKMSYRMNAQTCKGVVSSLKEMRLVKETIDNFGHYYEVMED